MIFILHLGPSQPKDRSLAQTGAILGSGVASGAIGSIPDLASSIYNVPASIFNAQQPALQEAGYDPQIVNMSSGMTGIEMMPPGQFQELPMIPSVTEAAKHKIDTATGGYTNVPKDLENLYAGAEVLGNVAGFGGGAIAVGKLGYKGLQKAGQFLGATKPADLVGAFATGTAMKAAEEDLGIPGALLTAAGAGALTTKGVNKLEHGFKALQADIKAGRSVGDITLGRFLAATGEPVAAVKKLGEKEGIHYSFNVAFPSRWTNFLANSYFKSLAESRDNMKIIENADQANINILKRELNSVHSEVKGPNAISDDAEKLFKEDKAFVKNNRREMYAEANADSKPNDMVSLRPVVDSMKEIDSMITEWVPSPKRSFVMNRVAKLAKALDINLKE